jgi:heat shock protein HslJ
MRRNTVVGAGEPDLRRRIWPAVNRLALLAAAVLLAGCAAPGADNPALSGVPARTEDLANRTYRVTSVLVGGQEMFAPGSFIELGLSEHGTLDVNASGCHYASGRYSVSDGRLSVADLDARVAGCGEVRDGRDWWFAQVLAAEPLASVDGARVLLRAADILVVLEAKAGEAWWELDPDFPLDPETRTLHLLVVEAACASGQSPEGRIQEPVVDYRQEVILIGITIRSLGPSANCMGNPRYPLTVELSEPLGDRRVVRVGP